jgi:hypothetical protein
MGPLCRCECEAEENFLHGFVRSFCDAGVLLRDGAFNYANDESTSQCDPFDILDPGKAQQAAHTVIQLSRPASWCRRQSILKLSRL